MPELNTQYQTPDWLKGGDTMGEVVSGFKVALAARDQLQQEKIQNLQAVHMARENQMTQVKNAQQLQDRALMLKAETESATLMDEVNAKLDKEIDEIKKLKRKASELTSAATEVDENAPPEDKPGRLPQKTNAPTAKASPKPEAGQPPEETR